MKLASCFCLTFVFSLNTFAQKYHYNKSYLDNGLIDIEAGIANPTGVFALQELTLPAGYAQPGYNIKLGLSYDIAPFLGVALQYQYTNNPVNSNKLLDDYNAKYPTVMPYNYVTSKPWELQCMLIGFYYPFKTDKTVIDVRLLGVLATGVLPEKEENLTISNSHYNFKYYENSASNFGYQFGVKIRYQLYKKLMLTGSVDYTYAKVVFSDIKIMETYRNIPVYIDDYTQKFQLLNISAGIGIQFN